VNETGAVILGALAGAALDADAYRIAGTGLIGSFTTFSTWMLETHRLGEDDQARGGMANLFVSLALGIAAVWIGSKVARELIYGAMRFRNAHAVEAMPPDTAGGGPKG